MNLHDVEMLSEYLDGQLEPSDLARIESRLRGEPDLRAVLEDLRAAREILRKLPSRKAPRNFLLTRRMAGIKPPMPRAYPIFRMATGLATLLLFFTLIANGVAPRLSPTAAAPGAPFGAGGGGGGPETFAQEAPAATEAPAAEPFLGQVPLPTGTALSAEDSTRMIETPLPVPDANKGLEIERSGAPQASPIPIGWQVGLAIIALLLGGIAFVMNRSAILRWSRQGK